MLDKTLKKKIFIALVIMIVGEILVIIPFFRTTVLTMHVWRFSLGLVGILAGTTLFYIIAIYPFGKEHNLIRLAILANPSTTMILSSLALIIWDNSKYEWLFMIYSLGATASFFVSLVLIMQYLRYKPRGLGL